MGIVGGSISRAVGRFMADVASAPALEREPRGTPPRGRFRQGGGSASSFGEGRGAAPASKYISTRSSSGWQTANVTLATQADAIGSEPDGVPYRLFSEDFDRALALGRAACVRAARDPRFRFTVRLFGGKRGLLESAANMVFHPALVGECNGGKSGREGKG
jgi:hypothetical protein